EETQSLHFWPGGSVACILGVPSYGWRYPAFYVRGPGDADGIWAGLPHGGDQTVSLHSFGRLELSTDGTSVRLSDGSRRPTLPVVWPLRFWPELDGYVDVQGPWSTDALGVRLQSGKTLFVANQGNVPDEPLAGEPNGFILPHPVGNNHLLLMLTAGANLPALH